MQDHDLSFWTHSHIFAIENRAAEHSTKIVMWITAIMMVVEIWSGWQFNSMALLADGWHMSSHTFAIGLSAFAYITARRYAADPRFAFGTWKIEILAGYTSAILLLGIAVMMVVASLERIIIPQIIHFPEAIFVAVVGLIVNIVCAVILGRVEHHHDHITEHSNEHHTEHSNEHHYHDLNLRSAYLHVIADASTSLLAIVALIGGMIFQWRWLDPIMGIIGAILVINWAWELLRDTGRILLDREMDHPLVAEIKNLITTADADYTKSTRIADLHLWRIGKGKFACILSLVTNDTRLTPDQIKNTLREHNDLAHVTVEIYQCT